MIADNSAEEDQALYKHIKDACLKLLTRREHSEAELIRKLGQQKFPLPVVQNVIAELQQQGWQSDDRFAESFTRHRIKQGYGPVKIAYELRQKGVAEFDLDDIVYEITGDWQELLEQVYIKKYGHEEVAKAKQWQRCSRFLQQRGFTAEMISLLSKKLGNISYK